MWLKSHKLTLFIDFHSSWTKIPTATPVQDSLFKEGVNNDATVSVIRKNLENDVYVIMKDLENDPGLALPNSFEILNVEQIAGRLSFPTNPSPSSL